MNTNLRDLFARTCVAHQSTLALVALLVLAFALIATNAIFNQPGAHPLPLWSSEKSNSRTVFASNDALDVPLRRVSTKTIVSKQVPVPVPRASLNEIVGNITPIPDQRPNHLTKEEKIQSQLTKLGFYDGPIDGLIGSKTKLAITKFERTRGLPETGKPTNLLLAQLNEVPKKNSKPKRAVFPSTNYDAKIVTRVQVGLINFGNRNIAIDGLMGEQTKLAIEKFQKRFKLEVTGMPSKDLIRKLVSVGALTAS